MASQDKVRAVPANQERPTTAQGRYPKQHAGVVRMVKHRPRTAVPIALRVTLDTSVKKVCVGYVMHG